MTPILNVLPNGLKILYLRVPQSKVVRCGWVLNVGTRNEVPGQEGLAHFFEHMVFKGTQKRKNFHILNYLESVGGDLDAYTSREKTCIYASLPVQFFERAVELLTDMTFFSTFPEKEIEKEKQVISEEIDMYQDSPEDAILEEFESQVFPDHSLGHNILGTKESVFSVSKNQLEGFVQEHLTQEKALFSIVGDISPSKMKRILDKYIVPIQLPSRKPVLNSLPAYRPFDLTKFVSGQQAHQVIGNRAYPYRKDLFLPFFLLNNWLGGPSNNSRLVLNIREKYGLAYNIYSFYTTYADSGLWGIYYACEPSNANRIYKLVMKELHELRTRTLSDFRLSQIKRQLIGQMTMGFENFNGRMLSMAKNYLDFGTDFELDQLVAEINAITPEQVREAATEIFSEHRLSFYKLSPSK